MTYAVDPGDSPGDMISGDNSVPPQERDAFRTDGAVSASDAAVSLRRLNRWLQAGLVAVTLIVFSIILQADFVHWDDGFNISENPHIRGINAQSLHWMFTDAAYIPRYMPLGWLSLAIDYQLAGRFNPATYHAGNLLLHCANTLLVFALLKALLRMGFVAARRRIDERALLIASALAALFWAIHPLRAEPVSWSSARIYCTASFFGLASVVCWLRYIGARSIEGASGSGGESAPGSLAPARTSALHSPWFWVSALAYLASLLTYPIGIALVAVLVIIDFYPLRRLQLTRPGLLGTEARLVWLEKIPFVAAALLMVVATLWARTNAATFIPPATLAEFGVLSRAMQAFYVWAAYLWKTWAPINLCPMYTTLVSFNPLAWPFLLSAAAVVGVSALLIVNARRWRAVLAMWLCYLVLLVPMLGLTEHPHHANDRYSYIPSVLWSFVIAIVLLHFWARRERRVVLTGLAAVLVAWAGLSFQQASHWQNRATLLSYITSVLDDHPLRAPQDVLLGFVHRERGEYQRAAQCFVHALRADPQSYDAHGALADVLSEHRQYADALPHYRDSLRLKADQPKIRENFAVTLASAGRLDEAVTQFEQIAKADPTNATVQHNLEVAREQLRKAGVIPGGR